MHNFLRLFKARRSRLIAAVVTLVVLATGATIFFISQKSDTTTSSSKNSGPPAKTGHEATDKKNLAVYNFSRICEPDGKPYEKANAYTPGQAPYVYATIGQTPDGRYNKLSGGPVFDDLKRVVLEPTNVPLTGCLTRFNERRSNVVCSYEDGSKATVYNTDYRLDIYETKTRKLLKTATVPDIGEAGCPEKGSGNDVIGPGYPNVYVGANSKAIFEAFEPLIR